MSVCFITFYWGAVLLYALILPWQKTAVNFHAVHKTLPTCFLLLCIIRIITHMQRTKNSSCAVHESWLAWSPFRVTHVFDSRHDKNWRTHACSLRTSVNLDVSCTVCILSLLLIFTCVYFPFMWWIFAMDNRWWVINVAVYFMSGYVRVAIKWYST